MATFPCSASSSLNFTNGANKASSKAMTHPPSGGHDGTCLYRFDLCTNKKERSGCEPDVTGHQFGFAFSGNPGFGPVAF
jgi:hypothetical protein